LGRKLVSIDEKRQFCCLFSYNFQILKTTYPESTKRVKIIEKKEGQL
jgi:hypothetical protein